MELHMPPLRELFDTVGQQAGGEVGQFFCGTAFQMAAVTGRSPRTAMKLQFEQQITPFSKEERDMMLELGGCLGRYDLKGQARAMELYRQRIGRKLEELEQTRIQKSKAWLTAAVCSGLTLIVMLL